MGARFHPLYSTDRVGLCHALVITDVGKGFMRIANKTGMKRGPTYPGEMLRENFLPDYNLTVSGLAEAVGVSRQSINEQYASGGG